MLDVGAYRKGFILWCPRRMNRIIISLERAVPVHTTAYAIFKTKWPEICRVYDDVANCCGKHLENLLDTLRNRDVIKTMQRN